MRNKWLYSVLSGLGLTLCAAAAVASNPVVRLETNYGNILLELFPEQAPVTVDNFLDYVDDGFYDGLIFHRVIADFVIQAGAYDPNLTYQTPGNPIINESNNGLANLRGTMAMARTNDPNSATSQFYINVVDNASLNYADPAHPGYAVFGEVLGGMTVVDTISQVTTQSQGGLDDVPVQPVIINRAILVDANDIDTIHVDQLTTHAGSVRGRDHFTVYGEFDLTPTELGQADSFEVHLGPWSGTIDVGDIRKLGQSLIYVYRGDPNGITFMRLNLNTGTFILKARDINLAGLKATPDFQIIAGSYLGTRQIAKTFINRGRGLPLTFLQGLENALKVDYFVHVNDQLRGTWLRVTGSMANTIPDIDLTSLNDPNDVGKSNDPNDMSIRVGSKTVTVDTFSPRGSHHCYRTEDSSADLLWGYFDMDRGRFSFFILNAGTVSSTTKLKITFPAPGRDYTFDQEVGLY